MKKNNLIFRFCILSHWIYTSKVIKTKFIILFSTFLCINSVFSEGDYVFCIYE